ncbi:hypothetical protein GEV49_14055 [Streptomyces sp. SYP-A7193]|nr:hypothetical protein GEV49_14055 [Streptomyces sp. SYP-A7193]
MDAGPGGRERAAPGGRERADRSGGRRTVVVRQVPGAALHWRGPGTGPPPRLPCRDRTVGLVQRASRADGSVPSAENRHPWFGRRPAWVMPSNKRRHAPTQDGAPVNSSLRAYRSRHRAGGHKKTGRSVGGDTDRPEGGFPP